MNEFEVANRKYRIKKMNAIQLLAIRSTMSFDDTEKVNKTYEQMLEHIEVNVKDNDWLQVKQGNNYYPAGIEDEINIIQKLITHFLDYMKSVFMKSSESNNKQE